MDSSDAAQVPESDIRWVWCRSAEAACEDEGVLELEGAAEAGERLRQTALRDFGPALDLGQRKGDRYRYEFAARDVPVPRLLKYALDLIGLEARGPWEKVEWWVSFTFRGQPCELAHQKFGLRLYMRTQDSATEAEATLKKISKQLRSSIRIVEKLILDAAPELLSRGAATVVNQHKSLLRAYIYFRERAVSPYVIEDESKEGVSPGGGKWSSFRSGRMMMQMNAFHDLVAAITAYLSLLEHDLVLALVFQGFDPETDSLTDVIGSRWVEKLRRVLGQSVDASRYLERLTTVVERWRNPYSHGGFEKGHGATIYLHAPGVGAIPVGLTAVRESPLFSFLPATDTDITQVFELFDEVDEWVRGTLPDAMSWIESGLDVRFDEDFRSLLRSAQRSGQVDQLLDYAERRQAVIDNMDYP